MNRSNTRRRAFAAAVALAVSGLCATAEANARELVCGILAPMTHPVAAEGVGPLFEQLKADTNGSLDWKIVPNGQILTGEGTLPGLRDRIADGGYLITPYSRSDTMGVLVMSRDTWNGFSAAEKGAVLKRAPMATMRATIKGYVEFDEVVRKEGEAKGIKFGGARDIDDLRRQHVEKDRLVMIDDAKKRGVKDPEGLMAAHLRDLAKWEKIVAATGHDMEKLSKALWDEVYSKVDPGKI